MMFRGKRVKVELLEPVKGINAQTYGYFGSVIGRTYIGNTEFLRLRHEDGEERMIAMSNVASIVIPGGAK